MCLTAVAPHITESLLLFFVPVRMFPDAGADAALRRLESWEAERVVAEERRQREKLKRQKRSVEEGERRQRRALAQEAKRLRRRNSGGRGGGSK